MPKKKNQITLLSYIPSLDPATRGIELESVDLVGTRLPSRGLTCFYGHQDGIKGLAWARSHWPELHTVKLEVEVKALLAGTMKLEDVPEYNAINLMRIQRGLANEIASIMKRAWGRLRTDTPDLRIPESLGEHPEIFDAVFRSRLLSHIGVVIWQPSQAVREKTGLRQVATLLKPRLVTSVHLRGGDDSLIRLPSIPAR